MGYHSNTLVSLAVGPSGFGLLSDNLPLDYGHPTLPRGGLAKSNVIGKKRQR